MNKNVKWLFGFMLTVSGLLLGIIVGVVYIDPFFHYHAPNERFFYPLSTQRNQNNGITKNFDYNAIITGTSMTENFKKTEVDNYFDVNSIKVAYSGGTYKEINDNLRVAFESHDDIQVVIRGLDMNKFFDDKDEIREDFLGGGTSPTYLYDKNPFNDVYYIFNRDVIFNWCLPAYKSNLSGSPSGITDFDTYSNWMAGSEFGAEIVLSDKDYFHEPEIVNFLTIEDKKKIKENICQNVTDLAKEYPETTFYYFFPPYSAAWYGDIYQNGDLDRQIAAERYVIQLILSCENIRLFSFSNETDITMDLSNYKDTIHYGEWINSLLLKYMKNDYGRLTSDNYEEYLRTERLLYSNFDYNSLFKQMD